MQSQLSNPCIRCGKERITLKEKVVKVGSSGGTMTYIQTICPDKACQKVVDAGIAEAAEKKNAINVRRAKEKEERERALAAAKSQ
jgi:hypothetical protein